jgi:hypothetical protein
VSFDKIRKTTPDDVSLTHNNGVIGLELRPQQP